MLRAGSSGSSSGLLIHLRIESGDEVTAVIDGLEQTSLQFTH
jgi:hypothetical protein